MLTHPWLVPIIPAIAAFAVLFFGTRLPKRGAELSITSIAVSAIAAIALAGQWFSDGRPLVHAERRWWSAGGFDVKAATTVDGLSVMMLLLVSAISLLVQIFSTNYMKDDRRYTHFFAVLTMFTAAMDWFVISGTTLQMVFGWEVMSLCSFLLIGHWWEEKRNVHAAMKAFLTTRAGDVGLFVGVAMLFFAAGKTFDVDILNTAVLQGNISHGLVLAAACALLLAVVGKSAQFPLHTWLPDAMAGPTPMSALIHAATMVVAGVFLMARLFPVFAYGFSIAPLADTASMLNPVSVLGGVTILIAAALALVQHDIKKLLSYSTVSQLGFMVMALGVGAWTSAIFHLFTHAFFKALLFLTAGSLSHSVYGFDIERDMGGLRKAMPWTHASFVIGAASLVGVVPLSGFWSKEQIVAVAGSNGYWVFQVVALLGTVLTAAYMARCYYFVFLGEHRGSSHPHEAPKTLTVPVLVLAGATVVAGLVQAPALGSHLFTDWLEPSYLSALHHTEPTVSWVTAAELVAVLAGLVVTYIAIRRGVGPRSLAERSTFARGVYRLLHNHYYLDLLYDRVVTYGIRRGLSWIVHWVDHNLIDNVVDAVGTTTVRAGKVVDRQLDRGIVDGAVQDLSALTESSGALLSRLHNGRLQRYIGVTVVVLALVVFAVAVGGR